MADEGKQEGCTSYYKYSYMMMMKTFLQQDYLTDVLLGQFLYKEETDSINDEEEDMQNTENDNSVTKNKL